MNTKKKNYTYFDFVQSTYVPNLKTLLPIIKIFGGTDPLKYIFPQKKY